MALVRRRGWALRLMMATATVAWLGLGGAMPIAESEARGARLFGSPEEVFKAVVDAMRAGDRSAMVKMVGPEGRDIVSSGDDVSDRRVWRRFVEKYDEARRLEAGGGKILLFVGSNDFPLPIPLVPDGDGWRFDTEAGREEILDRRVGRNELIVIQVCLAYVDAQREYFGLGVGRNGVFEYAQKLISAAGKRDGLYWPAKPGEAPSPLGEGMAQARAQGYAVKADGRPRPFHGYLYRILTGQGPDAPGGAYDYVARGHMIGGFGLVAYPAQYGDSGVMTFIVSHDGKVFQKDLGEATARVAGAMKLFNPDRGWQPADTTPPKK